MLVLCAHGSTWISSIGSSPSVTAQMLASSQSLVKVLSLWIIGMVFERSWPTLKLTGPHTNYIGSWHGLGLGYNPSVSWTDIAKVALSSIFW